MWIVRLALRRPYTFVVAAMLVMILGIVTIVRMPTDIFPDINIPVVSVIFNYSGMSPDDMERRIITQYEQFLTTTVNDIEHIESQSLYGIGVIKVYFQKNAKIEAAVAQVTAVSQTAIRIMPPGTQPPLVIQYSASNVPVIQLAISSDTVPEQAMFDQAINVLRRGLITVPGVQIPYPYGGKQRQVMVDLDPEKLYAYGISPTDVSNAINAQNVILPAGTVKIGTREAQVRLNSSPEAVKELNEMPIKTIVHPDGTATPIYIKDVAYVRDGFQVQTNVVHSDGKRGVLLSILKNGGASTLDVVNGVKAALPDVQKAMNPGLKVTPLFDQSVFVRNSVDGVIKEAAIAAGLTALMILLFLGSWRSTLIVVISIPLSILVAIIILSAIDETLNVMTLGGMALAVGILVDDATVEIENIHRNLHQRKRLVQAILDGASQIAVPAFVSTLCICIVFVPVVFITGAAKFLFTPLAMAVVFAMLTSYLLSRTLVPTMVHYLLASEVEMYGGQIDENDPRERKHKDTDGEEKPNRFRQWLRQPWAKLVLLVGVPLLVVTLIFAADHLGLGKKFAWLHTVDDKLKAGGGWVIHHPLTSLVWLLTIIAAGGLLWLIGKYSVVWRVHDRFNTGFEKVRRGYGGVLVWSLEHRGAFVAFFAVIVFASLLLFPFVGNDFFPSVDAGQIRMHIRAPAGTRIEETEKIFARVEEAMHKDIPSEEIDILLDNMGIPNSGINLSLSEGTQVTPADGEVMVSLKPGHKATEQYLEKLRHHINEEFPDLTVFFSPPDIATQVLNFGLSAPVDVQIDGPLADAPKNAELARRMQADLAAVPGVADPHLFQVYTTPDFRVDVDRTLANQLGLSQKDVASDLLISLSSSSQTAPNFWVNPQNGVNYTIFVQTPQYRINNLNDLENTPIVPLTAGTATPDTTQLLGNLATITRAASASNITHYNIKPTFDVDLNVQGADLSSVSAGVQQVVDKYRPQLPPASHITLRGQVQSMHDSFTGLAYGMVFAVVLVYLLMVINFQSWIDPLIILMALPGAIAGILWMLWATGTTLSVPALMGAIMSIGVATSNSILMITFANDKRDEGMNAHDAALAAGLTRLRPVIMTALAMIIGMLPMSLGLGEGGEQNAPLGRAVIGGLAMATFATLFFVPIVYSVLRKKAAEKLVEEELRD